MLFTKGNPSTYIILKYKVIYLCISLISGGISIVSSCTGLGVCIVVFILVCPYQVPKFVQIF